jgi:hypothetical protein
MSRPRSDLLAASATPGSCRLNPSETRPNRVERGSARSRHPLQPTIAFMEDPPHMRAKAHGCPGGIQDQERTFLMRWLLAFAVVTNSRSVSVSNHPRPVERLWPRAAGGRLRIPFEPGAPGEGASLVAEDEASRRPPRRPSPGFRPALLTPESAGESRSYKGLEWRQALG